MTQHLFEKNNMFGGGYYTQNHNFEPFGIPIVNNNNSKTFTGEMYKLGQNEKQLEIDDEIMFAIITSNMTNLKKLVNLTNVNKIIDKKNNYTALHHAVRIKKNDQIIEYLMNCGADPKMKQDEGKDCIDLSIEFNYKFLIDKLLKNNDLELKNKIFELKNKEIELKNKEIELDKIFLKFDDLHLRFKDIEKINYKLVQKNDFLNKTNDTYIKNIDSIKIENVKLIKINDENIKNIELIKIENSNLKRKFNESEEAFKNLLKKVKKN